jgi:hypothetical protein
MQKTRMMRLAGVSAVVLSAGLWALVPAWGQPSPAKGMAGMGGTGNVALTKDIAAPGWRPRVRHQPGCGPRRTATRSSRGGPGHGVPLREPEHQRI